MAVSATIKINGVVGSREDLILGSTITLSNNNNTGVISWAWSFLSIPPGSTATLSTPTSATSSFTADKVGSYLIKLIVSGGSTTSSDQKIGAVKTEIMDVRIPATKETTEFDSTSGWAKAFYDTTIAIDGYIQDSYKIRGRRISPNSPDDGYTYIWNASKNLWEPSSTIGGINEPLIAKDTKEPTGIVNRLDSYMSFSDLTRTLTIEPAGISFDYYINGKKHTVSSTKTKQIPNTIGTWAFYFDENEVLQTGRPGIEILVPVYTLPIVSIVYWSGNKSLGVADERHGIVMDSATHSYLHNTIGTRYVSGIAVSMPEVQSFSSLNGNDDYNAKLQFTAGSVADEDITISFTHSDTVDSYNFVQHLGFQENITGYNNVSKTVTLANLHSFEAGESITIFDSSGVFKHSDTVANTTIGSLTLVLTTGDASITATDVLISYSNVPVFYRTNTDGYWTKKIQTVANQDFPFIYSATPRTEYNNYTGGSWQLSDAYDGYFVNMWFFGSTFIQNQIIAIVGQSQSATLTGAENTGYESLSFGNLPYPEMKVLYRVTFQTNSSFSNIPKTKVATITDFRAVSNIPSGTFVATSHNTLTNLDYDNAGHIGFGRTPWESTSDPTANNDSADTANVGRNFRDGDTWLNTIGGFDGNGQLFMCSKSIPNMAEWRAIYGGGAGGDLSGIYPNPTVTKIQTYSITSAAPFDGYVLTWDKIDSYWAPRLGNYEIDALSFSTVNRGGNIGYYHEGTIQNALNYIGSNQVDLRIRKGIWKIQNNITIPNNVTLKISRGASFLTSNGITFNLNCYIDSVPQNIFSFDGYGTITGTIGNEYILPHWFGCKADWNGSTGTNDAAPLQLALNYSANNGIPIFLPANCKISTEYNMLLWGKASIIGADQDSCQIVLNNIITGIDPNYPQENLLAGKTHSDYPHSTDYNGIWINCGLKTLPIFSPSQPGNSVLWTGFLKNFTIKVSENAGDPTAGPTNVGLATTIFHLRYCDQFTMDEMVIDCRVGNYWKVFTTHIAMYDAWATSWSCTNGAITKNKMYMNAPSGMKPGSTNGGGGMINLGIITKKMLIAWNYLYGSGDDIIALLDCEDCNVTGNKCWSTHGRIGAFGGKRNIFSNNYHERLAGQDGYGQGGNLYACYNEAAAGTIGLGPGKDHVFMGNIAYIPDVLSPNQSFYQMQISGRNISVIGNKFINDAYGTGISVMALVVGIYPFFPGVSYGYLWTDPDGLDGNANQSPLSDGIAKPRFVNVVGNSSWGLHPAGMGEVGTRDISDVVGPITWSGNIAPFFQVSGPRTTLDSSNRPYGTALGTETDYIVYFQPIEPVLLGQNYIQFSSSQNLLSLIAGGPSIYIQIGASNETLVVQSALTNDTVQLATTTSISGSGGYATIYRNIITNPIVESSYQYTGGYTLTDAVPIANFKAQDIRGGINVDGYINSGSTKKYIQTAGVISLVSVEIDPILVATNSNTCLTIKITKNGTTNMVDNIVMVDGDSFKNWTVFTNRLLSSGDYLTVEIIGEQNLKGSYEAEIIIYATRLSRKL